MSIASLVGLDKLPPELAAALTPILEQLEKQVDETTQAALTRLDKIVETALDRIDGAQVIVVCTVKLPQAGSKMAAPAGEPLA